jgi:erythromycin esterase-like protein
LLRNRIEYSSHVEDGDEFHSSEQNARLIAGKFSSQWGSNGSNPWVDAEDYYKAMYSSSTESWNLRDSHMFKTLQRVLDHEGEGAKAVVWAHNSHVGDARASYMGWHRKELSLGQLAREAYSKQVVSLGCGTYTGTVAATGGWDADMQIMKVLPSLPHSYEFLAHQTGIKSFFLDLRDGKCDENLRKQLMKKRLERFIGVIYRPDTERQSHYCHTILPNQFDGYIWFDETKAIRALEVHQPKTPLEIDETYPFGM